MRICYLARANQFYFVRWYEYFTRRGHQVYVLSGDISHMNRNLAVPAGVEVYFLPEKKLKGQEISFLYNLMRLPLIMSALKKIIRNLAPDIIHAHQITPSGLWGALSNFHPFIITPIGSDVMVHARENFFYKLITQYALRKADLITSDSFALRDAIFQFGGSQEKTHIIQNGVDFSVFNPNVDGHELREKLDIDCIVKAIPRVLCSFPDAQFLFTYVMEDSLYSVEELVTKLGVENPVKFIGAVDYEEMPYYHSIADVLVSVPSSDSSPCSVYEAMACRTPVVVSDLPWTKHFMKNGQNAMIVPVNSPAATADAILKILHNDQLKSKLVEGGLSTVKKYVDYQKNMEMMENLMENIIRKK